MIILDLNYLEVVSEENNIEGSGAAALLATLAFDSDAQSDVAAVISQTGFISAQTGAKRVTYSSSIDALGLT